MVDEHTEGGPRPQLRVAAPSPARDQDGVRWAMHGEPLLGVVNGVPPRVRWRA